MTDNLVQRLRALCVYDDSLREIGDEAADRIEALERWLAGYRTSVESNDRRIEAQDRIIADQESRSVELYGSLAWCKERIEALEAALRWYAELDLDIAERARRALEGKP